MRLSLFVALLLTVASLTAAQADPVPALHGCDSFNGSVHVANAISLQSPPADGFRSGDVVSAVATIKNNSSAKTTWELRLQFGEASTSLTVEVEPHVTQIFGALHLRAGEEGLQQGQATAAAASSSEAADITIHYDCTRATEMSAMRQADLVVAQVDP